MSIISTVRIRLRDRLVRFYTDDLVRISRNRHSTRAFSLRREHLKTEPLLPGQRQEILDFWKPYRNVEKELSFFAFYNGACDDKSQLKYYIPDRIYYSEIDRFFSNVRHCEILDDKNLYSLYFHDVNRPRTIIRKVNGELLDGNYQPLTIDQAMACCVEEREVVMKEARLSLGGHGVHFYDLSHGPIEELKGRLLSEDNLVVQAVIRQHECLNRIHDKSINTIRIMSLFIDGKVHILSSVLRMGRDGSRVDNASSGGIVCGITENGTLKKCAFDKCGNSCTQHPQGLTFEGYKIEGYGRCRELVTQLAGRFCTATKLISWDLAIGEDGEPILIEANLTYGELDFHQLCNGPIFGDMTMTQKILSTVYCHRNK